VCHDRETGLFYNYFRDYDPATGRYVQSDPIGLAGGINPYAYAFQDPLRVADPTGEIGFAAIPIVALGVGGVLLVGQLRLCELSRIGRDLARQAWEACERARGSGVSCDCSQYLRELERAEREVLSCLPGVTSAGGNLINRIWTQIPKLAK
jgi:RHS repeat-associated protein